MKISNYELKKIKTEIPRIFDLISDDSNNILKESGFRKIGFSIWNHWLQKDELNLIYAKTKAELKSRQNIFLVFLKSLYTENETFIFHYNNWKKQMFIEKPHSKNKLIKDAHLTNLNADGGGGFSLILPKYKAIVETGQDWSGTITYKKTQHTTEKEKSSSPTLNTQHTTKK